MVIKKEITSSSGSVRQNDRSSSAIKKQNIETYALHQMGSETSVQSKVITTRQNSARRLAS